MEEKAKLQPFRMYANVYFVGCEAVSVHLLDTSAGLVLIDTGYPNMLGLIIENIEKMGFSPRDIKAILHTHGHIDHFGCTRELVALSGAKTYISRIDNQILDGTLDLSWTKELSLEPIPPFSCDVLLDDGDVIDFGDTQVRCVLTPGHTDGVMSYIITLPDGKVAGMHGGVGLNTLKSGFLKRYGMSYDCRRLFRESLKRLAFEQVDLVLGNHPGQTRTLSKMLKVLEGDGEILDRGEWQRFLAAGEKKLDELIEADPE